MEEIRRRNQRLRKYLREDHRSMRLIRFARSKLAMDVLRPPLLGDLHCQRTRSNPNPTLVSFYILKLFELFRLKYFTKKNSMYQIL